MSEENAAASEEPQQAFDIQRFYLKDVSFESPQTPALFQEEWTPKMEFQVDTSHQKLADEVYEVILHLNATVTVNDKNAFLVEVQHAGIFTVAGFEEEHMGHLLGAYCPNMIFPYAREVVSDLTTKGGFPPLVLAPVNFDAIYAQKMEQGQGGQNLNS